MEELKLDDEMAGAGAIRSSGKDLLKFLAFAMGLKDSKLKKSFELSQTENHKINEFISIGLGWQIIQKNEKKIICHNGATNGFASFIGFDANSKHGVVVLTNSLVFVDNAGFGILDFDIEELKQMLEK